MDLILCKELNGTMLYIYKIIDLWLQFHSMPK